ncbi:MAG TPA: hypothetical protein VM537_18545 [Anaerolineae bacterium]|nr:hypothetical protein [Anaerolineae bacterium]
MNAVGSALFSTLCAGTALIAKLGGTAIYNTVAYQGAAFPYVLFFKAAGVEANTSPRRVRKLVYVAKAVAQDDLQEAGEIDDLIDVLLHEQTLTVNGWGTYWSARDGDISYAEPGEGGVTYFHRGGMYRVWLAGA